MKPLKMRAATALICCVLVSFTPWTARGCPLCDAIVGSTLLRELDAAKTAILAELVRFPNTDSGGNASTGYRVVAVLKGGQQFKTGDAIDLPLEIPSRVGSVHLLLGKGDKPGNWQNPRGLSRAGRQFVRYAVRLPAIGNKKDNDNQNEKNSRNQLLRLTFLLPFLVSDDPQLAVSAHAEFASASYPVVKQLAPLLNPEKLKAWIELELGAADRRLLFTLLGVCGKPTDSRFVKDALDDRLANGLTTELDAIIAVYISLAGPAGLEEIERRILQPSDIPLSVRRAAVKALRFHADHESVIKKEKILDSCCLLLTHPDAADFVLCDLARWQDWESLDVILELWSTQVSENRWLEQPILSYLEACPLPAARQALSLIHKPGR